MKKTKITPGSVDDLANYYGFTIMEITGKPGYKDRKGKVYGLIDRRDGKIAAVYATKGQFKRLLSRFKS